MIRSTLAQNANIWFLGNLNFPGIDWKTGSIKPECRTPNLHQELLDLLADCGLQQVIANPTRCTNTLDLFITNNPTIVNRWEIAPSISDHDIVFAEVDVKPKNNYQKQRSIPLYRKADWEGFRQHIEENSKQIISDAPHQTVKQTWNSFKTLLQTATPTFVPHRTARANDS